MDSGNTLLRGEEASRLFLSLLDGASAMALPATRGGRKRRAMADRRLRTFGTVVLVKEGYICWLVFLVLFRTWLQGRSLGCGLFRHHAVIDVKMIAVLFFFFLS